MRARYPATSSAALVRPAASASCRLSIDAFSMQTAASAAAAGMAKLSNSTIEIHSIDASRAMGTPHIHRFVEGVRVLDLEAVGDAMDASGSGHYPIERREGELE